MRLAVTKTLTREQMLDEAYVAAVTAQMVSDLQVSMIERGLEPQSGRPQMQVELETTPGAEYPRAWWEVLLGIPAQRAPDKVRHIITITAAGIPQPRGGEF